MALSGTHPRVERKVVAGLHIVTAASGANDEIAPTGNANVAGVVIAGSARHYWLCVDAVASGVPLRPESSRTGGA